MNLKHITIATVGTSWITESFISVIPEAEYVSLEAVYSRDIEKAKTFALKHHADKYFDSLEIMAQDPSIDAVYIASPNFMHYEQTMLFLKAGKHVICEKSLASNYAEAQEMIRTARENQEILLEAMRPAYDPGLAAIKENLHKLGKVRRASFNYGKYSSKYDGFLEGKPQNIFSLECSAGALMDMGVYCVYPMLELFGTPQKIMADCVKLHNGIDGAGTALLNYGEMTADISYSKVANSRQFSEIQGEEATMIIPAIAEPKNVKIIYRNGREETLDIPKCSNNMVYEAQIFAKAIRGELDVTHYQDKALESMKLMDEIRRQEGIVFPADRKYK